MCKKIFIEDCRKLNPDIIVQKHLLDGTSYFFDTNNIDEFQFKKDIANSLTVHLREIAIVGSGKLGFSIKPDKGTPSLFPFKNFDDNRKSDLDIAIISSELFDKQLINLYEYTSQYRDSDIWSKKQHKKSMAFYVLKGWLKPEFIPKNYKISEGIQDMLAKYKMNFGRNVNIGIYKSWYYFENYHINNIRNIQLNLIANG